MHVYMELSTELEKQRVIISKGRHMISKPKVKNDVNFP